MYAYIPAKDVARARRFYEGKLGLKPKEEIEGGVAYEFARGTGAFLYDAANSAGTSKASQAFWTVTGIEKVVADLKSRGVAFEHYPSEEIGGLTMKGDIAEGHGIKNAWFKDTEGNIMALIEGPAS
jgi:catechol 2,3-dioxygenase-like lactoylglutathione lyase family enzyme